MEIGSLRRGRVSPASDAPDDRQGGRLHDFESWLQFVSVVVHCLPFSKRRGLPTNQSKFDVPGRTSGLFVTQEIKGVASSEMDTDHWITAVLALRKAKRVVIFTGAGVSAESGIPTFRDADGFWHRFPPEQFAQWSGLRRMLLTDRRRVAEFVLNVIEPIANAEPNRAHRAIVEIERHVPTTVVTQNFDGLHQSAGSETVYEIHGSLLEVIDVATGEVVHHIQRQDLKVIAKSLHDYVQRRSSLFKLMTALRRYYPFDWRGRNRPNLVLFGDSLAEPAWSNAPDAVLNCDLLLSVGTSLSVYPAAHLPAQAKGKGATVVGIGPQKNAGCWLEGKAGDILEKLVTAAFPSVGQAT